LCCGDGFGFGTATAPKPVYVLMFDNSMLAVTPPVKETRRKRPLARSAHLHLLDFAGSKPLF